MNRVSCFIRLNTGSDLMAVLGDKARQLIIISDALVISFMERLIDFQYSKRYRAIGDGPVNSYDLSNYMRTLNDDRNFDPSMNSIFTLLMKSDMFRKQGKGSYFLLDSLSHDNPVVSDSMYHITPLGLKNFVKAFLPIMMEELLSKYSLTDSRAGVSFRGLLYSNQLDLEAFLANSLLRVLNYKNPQSVESLLDEEEENPQTSDSVVDATIKIIEGTSLVKMIETETSLTAERMIITLDPNDSYNVSAIGHIDKDFFINLSEIMNLIIKKESVFGTTDKLCSVFVRESSITDDILEKFKSSEELKLLKEINEIKTVKCIFTSTYSLLAAREKITEHASGIVYSLKASHRAIDTLRYYSYMTPVIKEEIIRTFDRDEKKVLLSRDNGILPMLPCVMLGASGTYKTTFLNSIVGRVLLSDKLWHFDPARKNRLIEIDKKRILVIKLIVSEAAEAVTVDGYDMSQHIPDSNYKAWMLPYSKLGYYLDIITYCRLYKQLYDYFIIVIDSVTDQLLGQWSLQELGRAAQLKQEGLNPAARGDFNMLFAPIHQFNEMHNQFGKYMTIYTVANTDTNKSTVTSFGLVSGISPTAGCLIDESQGTFDAAQSLKNPNLFSNRFRIRRNSCFVDGIFPLEKIVTSKKKGTGLQDFDLPR